MAGFVLVAATLLCLSLAAPPQDEIHSLPGWQGPLPSRQYSGYLPAGVPPGYPNGKMHWHYWFVECETNPETAPVLVWYNGGPGASSLFGLTVELGPLLLNQDSLSTEQFNKTGIPTPIYNPYGWQKVANILAVNNPAPVGFSYCDPVGPTGNGYSCGNWNDSLVAAANHEFLANWIQAYPEFAKNDMYITGESYAGVYVPVIVQAIMQDPRGINLVGMIVGDGCMGTDILCGDQEGAYYYIEFMHGHGQFSNILYNQIQSTCTQAMLKTGLGVSTACNALLTQMNYEIGGFYEYALYDDCTYLNDFDTSNRRPASMRWRKKQRFGGAVNDYPCPGPASDMWLGRADVRTAIHVPVDKNYFDGDDGVGFNYTLTERNVLPIYSAAIAAGKRVLLYNGDADPSINSFVTQDKYTEYFASLNVSQSTSWTPWTLDGRQRMGGYWFSYGTNFHYLTVRGSGHMVPEYKPASALAFLSAFLNHEPFPPYVPPPPPAPPPPFPEM